MSDIPIIRTFNAKDLISFQTETTSKGNQLKWFHPSEQLYIKAQFQYQGKLWRDDLVEVIASHIGNTLRLSNPEIHVLQQKRCLIQEYQQVYHGVYSKNFCRPNQRFLTFYRILQINNLEFPYHKKIEEKWDFVLKVMEKYLTIDFEEYLIIMTLIDYLVGNEDRHLSNFGVLTDESHYDYAPLFDFGLGLFEHDRQYEGVPFRECLKKMNFKPFHKDGDRIIEYLSSRYDLKKYLPAEINLSGFELPSPKAGSYLLNRSKTLNITLKGV